MACADAMFMSRCCASSVIVKPLEGWAVRNDTMLAARVAKSDDSTLTARVTQWTSKTLPAVRAHLQQAEQTYARLEKGT